MGVYVGESGRRNFDVGVQTGTWGWPERWPEPATLAPGDLAIISQGGGGRFKLPAWMQRTASTIILGRITRGLYQSHEPLWPDEIAGERQYPYRVDFELLGTVAQLPFARLSEKVNQLMQTSATKQGRAFIADLTDDDAEELAALIANVTSPVAKGSPAQATPRMTAASSQVDDNAIWLFQANPDKWRIDDWLASAEQGEPDTWTASRYWADMGAGQPMVLWRSGANGGVIALCELTGVAELVEQPAFRGGEPGAKEWRVPIRLLRKVEPPIGREEVTGDPILGDLAVFKLANATNYRLRSAEYERILELAGRTPRSLLSGGTGKPATGRVQAMLGDVLDLQSEHLSTNSSEMRRRGLILSDDIPGVLREWVGGRPLSAEGRDGTGRTNRVPWVKVFDPVQSYGATSDWYVAYLFVADGTAIYLSLNQVRLAFVDNKYRAKSPDVLAARAAAARTLIAPHLDEVPELAAEIELRDKGDSARGYELGNVCARRYNRAELPDDEMLRTHLLEMLDLLDVVLAADLGAEPRPASQQVPKHQQPEDTDVTTPAPEPLDPSKNYEWLVETTLWERPKLDELLDTLENRRPQVVLAGPPGTGKTWVAESIALYLTGGRPGSVHTVQFHPTYGYEDFVEGLRPVADGHGNVAFDIVEGTLIQLAEQARHVDHPVVLVIDEMNRANLPSVFGELLYLLEYRDKSIRLLHRSGFALPNNLKIIATMNTADRSIRSIDSALRRRFDIFDCPPDEAILSRFYEQGNHADIPGLFGGMVALNDQLGEYLDRHHAVGHTFFMASTFDRPELERTWGRQIFPLIEEYFFDQADVLELFDLNVFWPNT